MFVDTPAVRNELTGGSIWDRELSKEDPRIDDAPRMISILGRDGKPYSDKTPAIRVSPDGVYIAVVL